MTSPASRRRVFRVAARAIISAGVSTHYDILGVAPTATQAEIQAQYRALAKVVHPDMGGDATMFAVLDESYEVLRDPVRRAAYDATLRRPTAPSTARPATRPTTRPTGPSTRPRGRPAAGGRGRTAPSTPAERAMRERAAPPGMTSRHRALEPFARSLGTGLVQRVGLMVAVLTIGSIVRSCG